MADFRKDRRTILALGAGSVVAVGAGVIFGWGAIRRPRQPDGRPAFPSWIQDGLQQVRATGLPGLLVVVPDGEDEMIRLSNAIDDRLRSDDADVGDLLAGAVWMCLRERDARDLFGSTSPLMRLDGDGKVIASAVMDPSAFEADPSFARAAGKLIDEDFTARVGRAWADIPDAARIREELKRGECGSLADRLPAAAPILIAERRFKNDRDTDGPLRKLLRASPLALRLEGDRSIPPKLPYGVEWASCGGGCTGRDPRLGWSVSDLLPGNPLVLCGMAAMSRVLKFLAAP